MNESYYFSHDYSSRSDEKIKKLLRKHGYLGYGLFWAIVEELYMNANALQTDYEGIAFDLHSNSETIKSIINDFDLFEVNDNLFGSLSIQRRLDERNGKSGKARISALKRWGKDANGVPLDSERNANALKNDAIKERKGKDIKESKKDNVQFDVFWNIYDKKLKQKDCLTKWEKLSFETQTKIIESLPKFLSTIKDKQFQPHPLTYLNGERWNDEIVKETKTVNKTNNSNDRFKRSDFD